MENFNEKLNTLFTLMGFKDVKISIDGEHRKISILIDDDVARSHLPVFLASLEHLINLMLHRAGEPLYIIDLNYYRRERERLIVELTKAAAHKAMITKTEVELPPMNAYERRLVHVEITTHPALKTESVGMGKDRRVVIRHLE